MGDVNDLEQRVTVIEGVLGLENKPPLDRLSLMEHRTDSLKGLMEELGTAVGELARTVHRVETVQLQHGRKIDELMVGQGEHGRKIDELTIGQREHGRKIDNLTIGQQELKVGQEKILDMLTKLVDGPGAESN